jgi:osmoprotectant transport system substrate-binding protein
VDVTVTMRSLVAISTAVALLASACAGPHSSTRGTVASYLVMGGPAECVSRITCLRGLQEIYGLRFKRFKSLDEVGPLSVAALETNQVQVVRLDSSDPAIPRHHWVILQDDRAFQQAGNIVPVIRTAKATDDVRSLLDKVSSTMTQSDLFLLDTEVGVDHRTPEDVARAYVLRKGLLSSPTGAGGPITVGSAAFAENETLADIYIDVLKSAGYAVTSRLNAGNREKNQPELEAGTIDLLPEYVGNYLTFIDPTVNTVALAKAVTQLRSLLAPRGLTVADPSSATDTDTIVVTQATADRFHLTKISDLARISGP